MLKQRAGTNLQIQARTMFERLHSMTKKAAHKRKTLPDSRLASEQVLLNLQQELSGKGFNTREEVDTFLASLTGMVPIHSSDLALSPQEEAQDLAFEAMEAPTATQALRIAKQALKIDPDCVDAIATITSIQAKTPNQMIAGMEKAVAAGERSLGPEFIAENTGNFWGMVETRPYMRAREQLAAMLKDEERYDDAAGHYAALLELNPNDNQGARYPLLCLYLAMGKLAEAQRLLKTYRHDAAAVFLWCRALERLLSGELAEASAALKTARKKNPSVERYLIGEREMPRQLPDMYAPGSDEEAVLCLNEMSVAWTENPEATLWLVMELASGKAVSKQPVRKSGKRVATKAPK